MPGEPLVGIREVGVEQRRDAAIFPDRAADEQFRLALERLQQAQVVVRIALGIDDDFFDAAQVQPLRGEVADERVDGAGIRQHAPNLLLEDRRLRQLVPFCERQQLIVGDAAPEEERQSRRDLQITQTVHADGVSPKRFARRRIHAKQKVGIDQEPFECELNAAVECSAVLEAAVEECNERLRIRGHGRPAIREPRHPRKDLCGTGAILFSTYIDVAPARRVGGRGGAFCKRATDLN